MRSVWNSEYLGFFPFIGLRIKWMSETSAEDVERWGGALLLVFMHNLYVQAL